MREAPGLPPRGSAAFSVQPRAGMGTTQTMQAVQAPLAQDAPTGETPAVPAQPAKFNYGWLLVAAAVIGAVLAGILLYAPK